MDRNGDLRATGKAESPRDRLFLAVFAAFPHRFQALRPVFRAIHVARNRCGYGGGLEVPGGVPRGQLDLLKGREGLRDG